VKRSLSPIAAYFAPERAMLMGDACAKAYGWSPRKA
jgi:hypothetical protein